jgi:DNA modification methylase
MNIRDRVRDFRPVPASSLRPSPFNWRTHPTAQRDALRGLLAEVGFAGAELARELPDGTLELIDGHLRAEEMGDQLVPVLVTDLTEDEAKKLLATFDPLGAMAGADGDKLDALLKSVTTSDDALSALLGDLARDNGLLNHGLPEPGRGGDDFDATPAEAGPTRTQPGDLWVVGGCHRLLVGDCTVPENPARLMAGSTAEVMWTDPPYGVNYAGKTPDALVIRNDSPDGIPALLAGAFAAADPFLNPGARFYVAAPAGPLSLAFRLAIRDAGWRFHQGLVWVKNAIVLGHSDYHLQHEDVLYGWKPGPGRVGRGDHPGSRWYGDHAQSSVFAVDRPSRSAEHPTIKPVELVSWMLANSSRPGDAVYDPFLGSGTTLVAAHRLGRVCYGCELEPRYADVVLRRAEVEGLTCERVG